MDFLATILTAIAASLVTTAGGLHLARKRMEREFRLQFQTEALVGRLLSHPQWHLRTFKTFQHHVGGFEEDELRKLLLQAGALRFEDKQGVEIWGLMDRNLDLLEAEFGTRHN